VGDRSSWELAAANGELFFDIVWDDRRPPRRMRWSGAGPQATNADWRVQIADRRNAECRLSIDKESSADRQSSFDIPSIDNRQAAIAN